MFLEIDNGIAHFYQERLKGFSKNTCVFLSTSLMKHVSRTSNEVELNNWTKVLKNYSLETVFRTCYSFINQMEVQ